jgi:hypothetical protein
VKIITFAKHENREHLNLRNSRNSRKFRETRAHFLDFACFVKNLKFRQKPYVRVPRISQSLHRSLSQKFIVIQYINIGQYVQNILLLLTYSYCMYCEIAYAVRYVQYCTVLRSLWHLFSPIFPGKALAGLHRTSMLRHGSAIVYTGGNVSNIMTGKV